MGFVGGVGGGGGGGREGGDEVAGMGGNAVPGKCNKTRHAHSYFIMTANFFLMLTLKLKAILTVDMSQPHLCSVTAIN